MSESSSEIAVVLNNNRTTSIIAITGILMLFFGMLLSRALMSIGMISIVLLFFNPYCFRKNIENYLKNRVFLLLNLIFLIYLFGAFYSEDKVFLMERLMIKLPFLLLPLGFAAMPEFSQRQYHHFFYIFTLMIFIAAVGSFGYYIIHFKEITESYLYAKVIPSIINHIRFSLMIAFSIFMGGYLYFSKYYLKYPWERILILAITLFLFLFLHIFSVRSGILAVYSSAILFIATFLFKKNKKLAIGSLAIIISLPILMYSLIPTLQNKVDYMIRDVSFFLKGENHNDYSDSNRLLSWKIGIETALENPVWGVGVGDIKNSIFDTYKQNYPEISPENHIIPHNQFIFVFAGCGMVGLFIFLFATLYPFIRFSGYTLFFILNSIIITSYISEATIENQLGTCFFLTFFLLTYSYHHRFSQNVHSEKV
jgi:O-antigen ligase